MSAERFPCTCGAGRVFYAHLHPGYCPASHDPELVAPPSPREKAEALQKIVDWQEAHPHIEVIGKRGAAEDEPSWVAYERGGPINDTEWEQIAEGTTWLETIRAAMAVRP